MSGPSGLPKFGGLGVEAWVSVLFSTKTELTPKNVPKRCSDIAPEARERRIVTTVKPFAGTLRVTNPARKSRASSRKRVLHDGGQPPL